MRHNSAYYCTKQLPHSAVVDPGFGGGAVHQGYQAVQSGASVGLVDEAEAFSLYSVMVILDLVLKGLIFVPVTRSLFVWLTFRLQLTSITLRVAGELLIVVLESLVLELLGPVTVNIVNIALQHTVSCYNKSAFKCKPTSIFNGTPFFLFRMIPYRQRLHCKVSYLTLRLCGVLLSPQQFVIQQKQISTMFPKPDP